MILKKNDVHVIFNIIKKIKKTYNKKKMIVVEEDTDTSDSYSFTTSSFQQEDDNFDSKNECKNQNFITLDDYTNDDPGLFSIKVFDLKHQSFGTGTCITKEEIKQWTENENNVMSLYSKPPKEFLNDASGKGTKPLDKQVFLLPNNNIYVTWKSIDKLMNETNFPAKYYAIPLFEGKRRRIGNMDRNFGVSRNHGQLDGSVIYKLYSKAELKNITVIKEDIDEFGLKIPLTEVFQRLDEIYKIKDDQAFLSALGTEFYYYPNEIGSIYDNGHRKIPHKTLKKKHRKEMLEVYKGYLSKDVIVLSHRRLLSLPSLFRAVRIIVDNNLISHLGEYPNVRFFNCNNNQLGSLPDRLPKIGTLTCNNNYLSYIPSYPTITRLYCASNRIVKLPENMLNLETLECRDNRIEFLPPLLPKLKELYCKTNQIESLPSLPEIKTLNCWDNKIVKLPENMPNLETLDCTDNQIKFLPPLLPELKELICTANKIVKLPENMSNLETLVCINNKIEYLPTSLPKLKKLDCCNNKIVKLPEGMPMIISIECYHNPIQKIVDIKRLYPNLIRLYYDRHTEVEANDIQDVYFT